MKILFKLICLLVLIGAGATSLRAMTWNDAVTLTKQRNNQLISAQKQLDSALWTYRKEYTGFLPQISANLSTATGVTSQGAVTSNNYAYGVSATEYLFNGPSNFFTLRSSYIAYEGSLASYNSTAAGIFYTTRLAFIDLLIAQANVSLQQKILERRKDNSRMIGLQYDSGQEDKGNLLRTQANEQQAAYNLSSARRDLKLAYLNLSQLLGLDVSTAEEQVAFGGEENPNYNGLLLDSPDYLSAKYTLDSADATQKATLSEFLPTVSLSGSYRKTGASWPPSLDSNSWGLNVSLPLFPGGSNIADQIINNINLDKARQDFEKSRKDVMYGMVQAYEKYRAAVDNVGVSRTFLDATTERAKIDEQQYLDGLIKYNDWDLAESEYISAQGSLLNAQKNALYAEAAWYKSYGGYK